MIDAQYYNYSFDKGYRNRSRIMEDRQSSIIIKIKNSMSFERFTGEDIMAERDRY